MKAFLCAGGSLTRCDAPKVQGSSTEIAATFGFKPVDVQNSHGGRAKCIVCRPINDGEIYLTIHGQERSVYALVIWEHSSSITFMFAASPFDLAISVEQVARYERAMHDFAHFAQIRDKERGEY